MRKNSLNGCWWFVIVLIAACVAATDERDPPVEDPQASTSPSEEQIKQWVRELSDDKVAVRDAATKNLMDLGTAAIPYLAEAHQGRQESGRQASRLVSGIEKELIASLDVPGVSFSNGFGQVRTIWIDAPEAARVIFPRLGWFRYLVRLQLAGSGVSDADFQLIDTELPHLGTLDLRHTKVTDESLRVVGGCANLNELLLPAGVVGRGLEHLRTAKNLSTLSASGLTDEGLGVLAAFPRLTRLDLSNTPISDAGLQELLKLPALKSLVLARTKISDDGLVIIGKMSQLECLDLRSTGVTSAGLQHLKNHERLALIRVDDTKVDAAAAKRLSREWNKAIRIGEITTEEVKHWVSELDGDTRAVRNTATRVLMHSCPDAVPYLYELAETGPTDLLRYRANQIRDDFEWQYRASLKTLDVHCSGNTRVGSVRLYDAGTARYLLPKLKAFAYLEALFLDRSDIGNDELRLIDGQLPRLQYLSLYSSDVTDDGLQYLSKLANLRDVNLFRCRIQGSGLKHLASLSKLEILSLSDTRIDDESVGVLAQLRHLTGVDLGGTRITNKGLSQLVGIKNLRYLNLEKTEITDAGLKLLPQFAKLEVLQLNETDTNDESLTHLKLLPHLKHLGLRGTKVTAAGLAQLKDLKQLELIDVTDTPIEEETARMMEERWRMQIRASNKRIE